MSILTNLNYSTTAHHHIEYAADSLSLADFSRLYASQNPRYFN